MHVLCRFKLYQTFMTAVLFPTTCGLLYVGKVLPETLGIVTGVSTLASIALFAFGEIFRRTVGFIYLCPEKSEVIISHLSWFGKRVDFSVDISEICPPGQENEQMNDIYWKIKFYDTDEFYLICTKYGGIQNKTDFKHIFGTF